jgi:hypothetical protein
MGARSVIALVVCTASATALFAVADGALVFFRDQPGHEFPTKASSSDPDVWSPGKPAFSPLLAAVVTAPRQTTDLAHSKPRGVITGGTSREEAAGKMANGSGAGHTAEAGGSTTQGATATGGENEGIRPQLGLGSSGRDVIDLQTRLNAAGSVTACESRDGGCVPPAPLNMDGQFGPKTLARVQEFQRNHAIPPDGIVGPQTWKKLVAL